VAFVQVKNTLQTWKLAAFIVAFFSPFFCGAVNIPEDFDYTVLTGVQPQSIEVTLVKCMFGAQANLGLVQVGGLNLSSDQMYDACLSKHTNYLKSHASFTGCSTPSVKSLGSGSFEVTYKSLWASPKCSGYAHSTTRGSASSDSETNVKFCPPEDNILYNFSYDSNGDGEPNICYKLSDINEAIESDINDKNQDDKCKALVLDSGNNSATDMCYTASNGSSCNIQKVTIDGGGTYYKGVTSSEGGCFTSEHPSYDDTGIGDDKDGCIYSDGTNYCEANRNKHCKVIQGSSICDDGCIDDGTSVFCDISKHPDVGEGDSDFFNDNGTCSVISASSSKGFCEDSGGTWDETQDYKETSCPVGAGTCSIASAGLCNACFDAGGTWTPDPDAVLTTQEKVGIETAALIKDSNDKLTQIEHGQRKTMESIQSTIKSGDNKVVSAIEKLGEKLSSGETKEEEKESFTTTSETPDKSAFKSMFGASAQAAVKERVAAAQLLVDTKLKSILAEAKTIFTVTVPAAVGYQVRNIQLSYGSVDASLSRYSDFFKALAGPIMMLCSLIAALALLRD
jgi:hypothetical protein